MKTSKLRLACVALLGATTLAACGSSSPHTTSKTTTTKATTQAHQKVVYSDHSVKVTSDASWSPIIDYPKENNGTVLYAASLKGQPSSNRLVVSKVTPPAGGLTQKSFVKSVLPHLDTHGAKASEYAINTVNGIPGYIAELKKGTGKNNVGYVEYFTVGGKTYVLTSGYAAKQTAWAELVELMSNTKWTGLPVAKSQGRVHGVPKTGSKAPVSTKAKTSKK